MAGGLVEGPTPPAFSHPSPHGPVKNSFCDASSPRPPISNLSPRTSGIHRLVPLRSGFLHAMLTMEVFLMTSADKPARGQRDMRQPFDNAATVSNFLNSILILQKAKKRLIATVPNSKTQLSSLEPILSQFLIATRNTILESSFTSHRPRVVLRRRSRCLEGDSIHSKQSPGDASNHHKMRGLQTCHRPSREAQ
jgi:hypothetical protein